VGEEVLVGDVDPAGGIHSRAGVEDGLVGGDVLPRGDLLERGLAELPPARHEHEAPEAPAQRAETLEPLREAVLHEARPRAPALDEGVDVVRRPPPEEDEAGVGKERVQVADSQAALRRLVDEAPAAHEEA
jgi:hypothetical protein